MTVHHWAQARAFLHLVHSCTSMQAYCVGQMLASNKGIPFNADIFFEEIASGDMGNTSSHSQLQSPELANQPPVQIQSSSAGLFNRVAPSSHLPSQSPELANHSSIQIRSSSAGPLNHVAREPHQLAGLSNSGSSWRTSAPSRFPLVILLESPLVQHRETTSCLTRSQDL